MDIKRVWYGIRMLTLQSGLQRTSYLKKKGLFGSMGENVMLQSRKIPLYPDKIFIGNNVRVASNVSFITHDVIHNMLNNLPENIGGVQYIAKRLGKYELEIMYS